MFWRILRVWAVPRCVLRSRRRIRRELEKMLSGGVQPVRAVLRAMALLQLAKGVSAPRIAEFIPLTPQAIRKVGHRYVEGGFERALYEKERPGAAALLEDSQKQRIIAMVCADPPEGHARWTVRLVAEASREAATGSAGGTRNHSGSAAQPRPQAVAGKKCGASRNSMMSTSRRWRMCSERTNSLTIRRNRWSAWMRSRSAFMPKCVRRSAAAPGREARRDSEYERCGTANVFCAVEPKAGPPLHLRHARSFRRSSSLRWLFDLAMQYPEARHHPSGDGQPEHPPPQVADGSARRQRSAGEVWDRFTVHYTPTHGSWLNQAEIEIGLFSRQCLGTRRIPDLKTLRGKHAPGIAT